MYKIKIFISSVVDEDDKNIFSTMRKKVKKRLERLELFNVYIYEGGYSTSKNVVDDYLDEIPDSHVCLFLINSADPIPDGVQKEIDFSRKLNKPQIYIFNHAGAKEDTPLEKELKTPQGSRVKIVNTFDKFFDESVESIKSEIVKIYKDYSSSRLARVTEEKKSSIDLRLSLTEVEMEKSYIKGFMNTKEHLCSFMGTEPGNVEKLSSNNLDEYTKSFLDVLIRGKEIKEFNTTFYLDELREWHRKEVFEVVQFRWRAIEYYFSGNLENCILNLERAYRKAVDNKIAPWLIQDILIDLRNKNALKYRSQNAYEIKPVYQKILSESKEVLTYPVIDRLNNELLKRIEKKRSDEFYKKAHSVTYDNIISEYSGTITSIYVVAAHYGSLTHLELIINKIQDVYFHLVENYSNWEFKINLLKTTAYLTNIKDMERILRVHNNILSQINSKDVEDILLYSVKHPDIITREKNLLLVLSHLGYYLEDNIYNEYKNKVESDFVEWIHKSSKNISLGDYYFKFFKENVERLDQNKIIKYANIIFSNHMARFNNEVLELLMKLDFKIADEKELQKLIKNIKTLLNEKKLDRFDYLRIVLVGIYRRTPNKKIEEIVDKYLPEFEKVIYYSDTYENQDSPYEMFLNSINQLEDQNNKASSASTHFMYGYNYFSIIKLALSRIENLNNTESNRLIKLLAEIVVNENQEAETKVNALQLLIYLKNTDVRFLNIASYYEEITQNDQKVLNVREGFIYNHTSLVVRFNYLVLKLLFNDIQLDYQFISDITSADINERLGISKSIRNYLHGNKVGVDPLVIHLLFILKSDKDAQVRVNSLFGFFNLLSNHEDEIILVEISKMMNTETTLIKNIILRNIDIINDKNPDIAKYILQKGRIDSHYLIRKQVKGIGSLL